MEKNHLKTCLSPYLQQHATNPVHWYPWGEEALKVAKEQNKPILLSIGYSACHWCHVMAHESFEDEETAEIMNQHFVNIKVDREERPDLDKIYQTSHQLLNQSSGGWPLTVFLMPDSQIPFFSATYFPKEPRHGLPGFKSVLFAIIDLFQDQQKQLELQNEQMQEALTHMTHMYQATDAELSKEPIEFALDQLEEDFDEVNGGFGTSPKFPVPTHLQRLLRRYHGDPRDKKALKMLKKTLDQMAMGGIYDQIGGGFFRYSVDAYWEIPHFEKMLYDNGPLLAIYAQAAIFFKNRTYATVAEETALWAMKKMRSPAGGFYSTLDADSLGIEGKFYIWDRSEIKELLSTEEFNLFKTIFNLQQYPNFHELWHLQQVSPISSLSHEDQELIKSAKTKLLQTRKLRIAPHKDEKILTSWNGLMIRGLSIAGFLLENSNFVEAAHGAIVFLQEHLIKDQQLFACFKDKTTYNIAFLDDYAFLLDGLLFYLQAKFDAKVLNLAIELAEQCIEQYYDSENGGFYYTAHEYEQLIQRPKVFIDEALPSGNGIMAFVLNRLGHLAGNTSYLSIAENTIRSAWQAIETSPTAHQSLLHALEEVIEPPEILVVLHEVDYDVAPWKKATIDNYNPHRLCLFLTEEQTSEFEFLKQFSLNGKSIVAFSCKGSQCSKPVESLIELQEKLSA